LQATLGDLKIEDYSMKQEGFQIFGAASRICTCLVQYLLEKKLATPLVQALLLYLTVPLFLTF
jgi:hypothetical protein